MVMKTISRLKSGILSRPLFFLSILSALFFYVILTLFVSLSWSTKLLMSWDVSVMYYLFVTTNKLWHADPKHIFQRAQQQDESKWVILFLVILTLIICMITIVVELIHLPENSHEHFGRLLLSILTIILAWFFIHTMFAIHYAHDFYLSLEKHQNGGLDFPKTPHPNYPDFIYFSYVIGTSAQTADIALTSSTMRKLNLIHIIIAYGFNTTILAIVINIAAGFISA